MCMLIPNYTHSNQRENPLRSDGSRAQSGVLRGRCEVPIVCPDFGESRLLRGNQMDEISGPYVHRCCQLGGKQLGPGGQGFFHGQERPNPVPHVVTEAVSYFVSLMSIESSFAEVTMNHACHLGDA